MSDVFDPKAPPVVPGPLPPPTSANGLAIASLVLGILSLCGVCIWCAGLPMGVAGLLCAYVSKDRSGIRTGGLICSIIGTLLGLLFAVFAILRLARY